MSKPKDEVQPPYDWRHIATAPKDGTQVLVAHALDPSSMKSRIFKTTGSFDGSKWICSAAFVCIDGMLRWQPTHWREADEAPAA